MHSEQFIPPSPQLDCRLLQLPQELRSMILNELLYSPIPLAYTPTPEEYLKSLGSFAPRHFSWHDYRQVHQPNFDFYPRILETCQALYYECYHILYEQNVLAISLTLGPSGKWNILAEQDSIDPPSAVEHFQKVTLPCANAYGSLKEQLIARIVAPPDPWSAHSRWAHRNILNVLPRMRTFEIRITSITTMHMDVKAWWAHIALEFLGEVLKDKKVRVLPDEVIQVASERIIAMVGCRQFEVQQPRSDGGQLAQED